MNRVRTKAPTARQIDAACHAGFFVYSGSLEKGTARPVARAAEYREGEITIKGRVWINMEDDYSWHYIDASEVTITTQTTGKETDDMASGKRAPGRPGHVKSGRRPTGAAVKRAAKGAKSNNDNLEFETMRDRRIAEIEEAQELVETASKKGSAAIERAHKNLKDAKDALVTQMHAHDFDADKNPVYTRLPWGSVVLQKKGKIEEEAKFTAGTAKPKKKKSTDDIEDESEE